MYMPLTQAKCTNCGAELEVDSAKDAAICPYCNSAYIVEKAINNYNVTNNIENSIVNIYSNSAQEKSDFDIDGHTLKAYIGESEIVDNIPSHILTIDNEAFKGNKKLIKVIIPNSVKKIESNAFEDCKNLKEIIIPDSVESICKECFLGCISLKEIFLPDSVTYLSRGVFRNCESLEVIRLSPNIGIIYASLFYNCTNLQHIELPKRIYSVPNATFENCKNLQEITIPYNVEYLGDRVFQGCESLKKVIFEGGHNITSVGRQIFKDCHRVPEIIPPEMAVKYKKNFDPNDPLYSNDQKKGCYIATCVYGSYDCPEVWTLRRFRDDILEKNILGRLFIKAYYSVSPKLVSHFGDSTLFRSVWRKSLDKLLLKLRKKGIEDTPYTD